MKVIVTAIVMILFLAAPSFAVTASKSFLNLTKPTDKISANENASITLYRKKFLPKASSESKAGKHMLACTTYQQLLDALIMELSDTTADKWLSVYGRFYQEINAAQLREKNLYESSKALPLTSLLKENVKLRQSNLPKSLKVAQRIPLARKGSISSDEELLMSVIPSKSPFHGSLNIVGFFSVQKQCKVSESLPVPDDRSNPQINRWGRNYSISSPVWSPDGYRYAYLLNGALCVGNFNEKTILISSIPDSADVKDVSFSWSSLGQHLVYIRADKGARYVYWNKVQGGLEQKIGKGSTAVVSANGDKVVYGSGGAFSVCDVSSQKTVFSFKGEKPVFMYNDKNIAFLRKSNYGTDLILKNLADGSERIFYTFQQNVPVVNFYPICANAFAVSLSNGNLWLISDETRLLLLKQSNGSLLQGVQHNYLRIVCEKEIIHLKIN